MEVNKEELRRLAEKATQGHWKASRAESHGTAVEGKASIAWCGSNGRYGSEGSYSISGKEANSNARYIAASSPAAILSLLDENAQLRAENERLRGALSDCIDSLHGEMLQKFGGQLPDDMHPVTRRDYDRDQAELAEYRAVLDKEGSANG